MLSLEQKGQLRKVKCLYFKCCMNEEAIMRRLGNLYLFECKGKKNCVYVDEETDAVFQQSKYMIFKATLF